VTPRARAAARVGGRKGQHRAGSTRATDPCKEARGAAAGGQRARTLLAAHMFALPKALTLDGLAGRARVLSPRTMVMFPFPQTGAAGEICVAKPDGKGMGGGGVE
jgi:ABC-type uncharacterized transport system YnjBCD ATPase subunit